MAVPQIDIFTGVTLNVPAGLWGKKQFTPEEVRQSRKISVARIHVERAIKYIKDYHVGLKVNFIKNILSFGPLHIILHTCQLRLIEYRNT